MAITEQAAAALAAVHAGNLVHRDVNPNNIMIETGSGRAVLLDLGIARAMDAPTLGIGGLVGTIPFMAPEQVEPGRPVTTQTDVYQLGATAFALLASRPPFVGALTAVLAAIVREDPPDLSALRSDLPPAVGAVLAEALTKDPAGRPTGTRALAIRLREAAWNAADSLPPTLSVHEPWGRTAGRQAAATEANLTPPGPPGEPGPGGRAERPDPAAKQPRGRSRTLAIAGCAIALLLLAGAGAAGLVLRSVFDWPVLTQAGRQTPGLTTEMATATVLASPTLIATASPLPGGVNSRAASSPTSALSQSPAPATSTPTAVPTNALTTAVNTATTSAPTAAPTTAPTNRPPVSADVFARLPGTSGAVALLPGGERIDHNADQQRLAASVIKLWIAAAAFEQEAAGRLRLSDSYTIRATDDVPGTGILNQNQNVGRSFTYTHIIETMLMYSDNAAANIVIARLGGFQPVNDYARSNGYERTLLQRSLGRPDPSRENFTSARDSATFLDNLLKKRVVGERASDAILTALVRRRGVEDREEAYRKLNYFGRFLPGRLDYRHLSGLNPGVRNDVGYYPAANGGPVIVATLLSNLVDEASGEEAIGRTVLQIYQAVP